MAKRKFYRKLRKRLRQSWLVTFATSFLVWLCMHLLFFTCRKQVFGADVFDKLSEQENNKILSPTWHRSIFYSIYYFRNRKATIMSSRSGDGNFVTQILRRFGFFAPRGSSGKGKGGSTALKQFVAYIKQGNLGGLAVDAPKGPPYISKFGIVVAAARTGAPLLPHIWYAQPNYRIKSWDRSIIPKLFSELVMVFDCEAMRIPADASDAEVEAYREELDQRLRRLTYQVDHWFELRSQYDDPRDIPLPDPIPMPHHPE